MENQFMGPGGPGGGSGYNPTKNKPVVTYSTAANNAAAAQAALQNVIDNKNKSQESSTAPGVVAIPTMGKNTGKFKNIEDKLKSTGYGSLTPGEQMIADFYLSSAVNPYQQQLQNFIESSPAAAQAYQDRFPITSLIRDIVPLAVGSATGVPFSLLNQAKKGLQSLKEDEGALGMIANIPDNIINQFTSSQTAKMKAIADEKKPLDKTLQEGPLDPNSYGSLGGDRFDVEEDIFQTTLPENPRIDAPTVYDPNTNPFKAGTMEYELKQRDINERNYPYLKTLRERENIAQEVEDATESVVPGSFDLEKFGPDEFGQINIFGSEPNNEVEVAELGLPADTSWQDKKMPEGLDLDALINMGASQEQIAQVLGVTAADGGYLNKFDDGGYANMSTYQKLKMMADNYGK